MKSFDDLTFAADVLDVDADYLRAVKGFLPPYLI